MSKILTVAAKDVDGWELRSSCGRTNGIVDHTLTLTLRLDSALGRLLKDGSYGAMKLRFEDAILEKMASAAAPRKSHVWGCVQHGPVSINMSRIVEQVTLTAYVAS